MRNPRTLIWILAGLSVPLGVWVGLSLVGLWDDMALLTWHGWLALGLGAGLTMALGVGLMALVFFSARRGYDDQVITFESDKRDQATKGGTRKSRAE